MQKSMQGLPNNVFSFMAAEDENAKVSIHNNRAHLHALEKVDAIFRSPMPHLKVPGDLSAVARLYLFIHYQLYAVFTNLMRLHMAEALACERKAIDAALSAYKIIDDPSTAKDYEGREWEFQNIKAHIAKIRKNDEGRFPLANELIKSHDVCSEYGSHADVSTFVLRVENQPIEGNPDELRQLFLYFQVPGTEAQNDLNYVDALSNFLTMTRIFDPFFAQHTGEFKVDEWAKYRDENDAIIRAELAKVYTRLEQEPGWKEAAAEEAMAKAAKT